MKGGPVPFIGPPPPRGLRWIILAELAGFVAFAIPWALAGGPGAVGLAVWLGSIAVRRLATNRAAERAIRSGTARQDRPAPLPSLP